MILEDLIDKKVKVKIIDLLEDKKYYLAESINEKYKIYIENTLDYEYEELIGQVYTCIITKVINNNIYGFLLTNRKFENDLKRIANKLKDTPEFKNINDIYLMERLKIKGKVVGLYMVDEGSIGKYYLDTYEIGTFSKKTIGNNIIFKSRKVEDELGKQIKDVVMNIDLMKKEISLIEEQEKQRHLIEKALGLEDKISRIAIMDLSQVVERKEINQEKNKANDIEMQKKETFMNNMNLPKEESKENDVNIKQELKMNSMVTDMKTLGQVLDKNEKLPKMEGKKFTKMGVIESDHRDEVRDTNGEFVKPNTTRYSFVAIANDGTIVPMDLQQDYQEGINPSEKNYQISQKGEVQKDDVQSRFEIGEGTFAVKNGQYGELKVYHSPRKTIGGKGVEGNQSLDRELETDNVWIMKKEQRDLAAEYKTGYRSVERGYQEAKQHENDKGEILEGDKLTAEDIDGDKNTKSHEHVNYDELASKWGYYIDGKPNSNRAKEIFEEKIKENPDKDEKEIIEMVSEEIDEELRHQSRRR